MTKIITKQDGNKLWDAIVMCGERSKKIAEQKKKLAMGSTKSKKDQTIERLAKAFHKMNSSKGFKEPETHYLKDGTVFKCEALRPGATALVEGGSTTSPVDLPLPTGTHELVDGRKIIVGSGGVIIKVTPVK